MTPHKRSAQSLGRNVRPSLVIPWIKNSLAGAALCLSESAMSDAGSVEGILGKEARRRHVASGFQDS
jgi:hypothetical protein